MRAYSLTSIGLGAFALIASAAAPSSSLAQGGAQGAAGGCVSPLPPPAFGGMGMGGRGFGGRAGPPPNGGAQPDSSAAPHVGRGGRGGRGRGARAGGCPPFFPDSLALSATQSQQIVALRTAFRESHASEFAQLKTIGDSARSARAAGATVDQVRAIQAQARPINQSMRADGDQVQKQVEALLTPGQLAWMNAFRPPRRRGR